MSALILRLSRRAVNTHRPVVRRRDALAPAYFSVNWMTPSKSTGSGGSLMAASQKPR